MCYQVCSDQYPSLATAGGGQGAAYFKKAVDDAESEWSQHHAKRWIDTSAKARAALLLLSSAG